MPIRIPQLCSDFLPLSGESTSELNDSPAHRNSHSLCTIAGSELLHEVFDMNFDCLLRNKQPSRDVAISVPARQVLENIHLARRETLIAQMLRELRRQRRRDAFFARMYLADRQYEFAGRHILQQV